MRLGFIGTGLITESIVTGLCLDPGDVKEIWVSPRSKDRAERLSQTHTIVNMAQSNQEVVDHTDILFLAFLPGMEEAVLNRLSFRNQQIIVSVLAGIPLAVIRPFVMPAKDIVRAIPLPCTALCTGPVVMFPDNTKVQAVFIKVGSVIIPRHENQLEIFSLITALMSPFYSFTETAAAWGASKGLDKAQSAAYASAMFKALAQIAETAPNGDIGQLATDSMTPGGLNETAMKHIVDKGGFSSLITALDAVADKFSN